SLSAHTTHQLSRSLSTNTTRDQNGRQIGWTTAKPVSSSAVQAFAKLVVADDPSDVDPGLTTGAVRTVPLPDGGTVWVALVARGEICEDYATQQTIRVGPVHDRTTEVREHTGAAACDPSRSYTINPMRIPGPCGGVVFIEGHVNAKPGSRLQL